jgi:hypothetical protein
VLSQASTRQTAEEEGAKPNHGSPLEKNDFLFQKWNEREEPYTHLQGGAAAMKSRQ